MCMSGTNLHCILSSVQPPRWKISSGVTYFLTGEHLSLFTGGNKWLASLDHLSVRKSHLGRLRESLPVTRNGPEWSLPSTYSVPIHFKSRFESSSCISNEMLFTVKRSYSDIIYLTKYCKRVGDSALRPRSNFLMTEFYGMFFVLAPLSICRCFICISGNI